MEHGALGSVRASPLPGRSAERADSRDCRSLPALPARALASAGQMQSGTGGATDAEGRCNRLRPFMSQNPRFLATKPRSGTACERSPQKGNLRPGIFLTRSPCVCRTEGKIAPIRARTRFRGQKRAVWPHETERHAERTPSGALLGRRAKQQKPFREANAKARKRRGPFTSREASERRAPAPKAAPSGEARALSAGAQTHRARRLLERKPSFSARRRVSAARGRVSASHPGARHPERALDAHPLPRRAAVYMWRRRSTASHSASEAA